ncbi:hypothetical protein [Kangiella sp.]|uniref:hypothetical protein n=1 Tax=Kangiella sp. TaxID=1920245 RepID=UPI003A923065
MNIFQSNFRDEKGCDIAVEQIAELIDKLSFNLSVTTRRKNHAAAPLIELLFSRGQILKVGINETIKSATHFFYSLNGGFNKDTNAVAEAHFFNEYTHSNVVDVFFGVTT